MEDCKFDAVSGCLTLSGEFTVYQAATRHQYFLDHCADGSLQTINLNAVTELDCAGLQLLLGLLQTATAEPVRLVHPSAAVRATFSVLQMDELLSASGGYQSES